MVLAAGHFKETQTSAILEAVLNILVSIFLVFSYGLVGVAIGTLVAMTYRTIYLAWYLRDNILNRPFYKFLEHIVIDALCVIAIVITTYSFHMEAVSWFHWIICAFKTCIVGGFVVGVIHAVFYHSLLKEAFRFILKKRQLKRDQ